MLKAVYIFFCSYFAITISYANSHHPQEFIKSIQGVKDEGRQIVEHFCASCHAPKPLIELGAPKINSERDWSPRIKKGLASLLQHTEEGFNAMPARGGCFECSDKQLHLAVLAMLPKPLRKLILTTPNANK